MEGFFMYDRAEQILSEYPKEFTGHMKGRGSILAMDSEGIYLLGEYHGSQQRLERLVRVLEYLRSRQFLTEEPVLTKDGQAGWRDVDGRLYFLRKTWQGRECDTRSDQEILHAVRLLARLHLLLADAPDGKAGEVLAETSLASRRTRELKKVKNYLRKKKKKNEFETEFLRGYAHYMEQASRVLALEAEQQFPEMPLRLCHGDVNQHNFLFTERGLALLGFDRLRMDLWVADLANFMRKILEKQGWNSGLGMDMVMAYNGVRQLEPWELRQLYLRLLYPEKYWKLANHYYNGRKTWVSGRDIEKLRRILEQEPAREEFLSMLFYLVK
jgi:CotS family spore coat protein